MEGIVKILELLNKPLHFFVIGLFVLIWGVWIHYSLDYIFLGILSILLSICSFIDKQIKSNHLKKDEKLQQEKEQKRQERLRLNVIKKYENMPYDDLSIVDECIDNNYPVFKDRCSENKNAIVSLCSQGWGISNNFDTVFTMKYEYFQILLNYKKEKSAPQKRAKRRNKAHAE